MHKLSVAVVCALTVAASASASITPAEKARLQEAARVVHDIHETIPSEYWNRAHCVLVVPELKKAALVVGGEYGKGVMSCRAGSRWSAPVFMELARGSWGFQAGAEQIDVVLLVMNEDGAQKLLQSRVNLGADASIAAGPVGRTASAATDAHLTAEILAYSRSKGLFAGIDLSGGSLRPDKSENERAYGPNASPREIALGTKAVTMSAEARTFAGALGRDRETVGTTGVK